MHPRTSAPPLPRNHAIDTLRGIAILLVVLHHTGIRIPLRKTALHGVVPDRILNALIYNGTEAVFIFFVISGFLITSNSLQRWGELRALNVRAFYARRFARIVPCLVALVGVLSLLHLLGADDYRITRPTQSLGRAVLAAFGLHLNWYEGATGYLPGNWDVLWSLSIEEVFYLAFPVVCLALRSYALLVPALTLFALSLPFTRAALASNEIWQEKAYLPGMSAIAVGVLSALLASRLTHAGRTVGRVLMTVGAGGIVAVLFVEDFLWPVLGHGTLLLLAFAAAAFVIGAFVRASPGEPERALKHGWIAALGRESYEVYLTHMFVVVTALRVWKQVVGESRLGFLVYVPVVVLSWGLGAGVSKLFSIPAERALKRWLLREA